ncbi:MAG: lipid-binding SYLF domain-containing protein [Opitutaceae bacterium]
MNKLFVCLLAIGLAAAPIARANESRDDLVAHLQKCESILRDFQSDPDTAVPPAVFAGAHAVVIVHQIKASFLLGLQGGYAIALVKKRDGHWSVPGFMHAGEASFGLQAGGKVTDLIYVITDDATAHNLLQTRFNVGVDAKAVAGPHAKEVESSSDLLKTPVLIYSKTSGLYAGATVKGGYITRDDEACQTFYNTHYGLPEVLYSNWIQPTPETQSLMSYVQQLAP